MGKTVSAADMLSAGRRRSSAQTADADSATERLDDSTLSHLLTQTPKQPDDQAPERLDATALRSLGVESSERSDDSKVRSLDAAATRRSGDQSLSPTYQRATVFFTPQQRQWIKRVTRDLPEGLSMSDVVRLAVSRLQNEVANGLDLVPALAEQAHADAEIFTGRRNRGLPSQHEQTA